MCVFGAWEVGKQLLLRQLCGNHMTESQNTLHSERTGLNIRKSYRELPFRKGAVPLEHQVSNLNYTLLLKLLMLKISCLSH